jgi:hypothetical protein
MRFWALHLDFQTSSAKMSRICLGEGLHHRFFLVAVPVALLFLFPGRAKSGECRWPNLGAAAGAARDAFRNSHLADLGDFAAKSSLW